MRYHVRMKKIAIIGGGASGLAAAVSAAEAAAKAGIVADIAIYEASDRVGRSILATGNGRCNFSNVNIDPCVYRNSCFVEATLPKLEELYPKDSHPNGIVGFFADRGMLYREEGDGRLYPLANKASVVLDILRASYGQHGVQEVLCSTVVAVEAPSKLGRHFTLRMSDGVFQRADAVIVACGGKVAKSILPDGFEFLEQKPVLCSIATDVEFVCELDNIRAKAAIELRREGLLIVREQGEVMFRKYGVSGICAFNVSRFAEPGDVLSVDFLPAISQDDMTGFMRERMSRLDGRFSSLTCSVMLRGMVLPRVADVILKRAGLDGDVPCTDECAQTIASLLKQFRLEVRGVGDACHAQVQRGGFCPDSFNPTTLESRMQPGLFVTGEALDVDAPCGGYNLHWAFATGLLAGNAAVSACCKNAPDD